MLQAPPILITERLMLRRPQLTDATALFEEYCQDPEVTKYLIWRPHKDIQETINFLTGCLERWASGEELTWGITHKGNERIIGMVACRLRGHMADIGYVVARKYWNQGYVTEAVRAVVDWAAHLEAIFRVWAVCDTDNGASVRVLEKVGMSREGVLRRWVLHPNVSAEPRDCFVYSKYLSKIFAVK
jgi:[ribosomal protein S5]-alanine N-acetyltransferase